MIAEAVGGAVSILGGITQFLNSREASQASAADIAKLRALQAKIKDPNFDRSQLNPEDYKVASIYVPQVAPYIAEVAPQTVQAQGQDARTGNAAQREALQQLMEQSRSGSDVQQEIANRKAQQAAAQGAQANRSQLDESFARRGQLGSGMQYSANLAGNQDIQNQQGLADQNAAVDAANRRNTALNQSATLGGNLYNQDVGLEKYNVGLINDFNERNTRNQNDYNKYAGNIVNQGHLQNNNRANEVSDKNVQAGNAAQGWNIQNNNEVGQKEFEDILKRYNLNVDTSKMGIDQRNEATRQYNTAIGGVTGGVNSTATYLNK